MFANKKDGMVKGMAELVRHPRPLRTYEVIVADGTDAAERRLERVLTADPAMGIFRHVDAGYDRAVEIGKERGVKIP